jgi:hypothetical protein
MHVEKEAGRPLLLDELDDGVDDFASGRMPFQIGFECCVIFAMHNRAEEIHVTLKTQPFVEHIAVANKEGGRPSFSSKFRWQVPHLIVQPSPEIECSYTRGKPRSQQRRNGRARPGRDRERVCVGNRFSSEGARSSGRLSLGAVERHAIGTQRIDKIYDDGTVCGVPRRINGVARRAVATIAPASPSRR